MIVKNKYTKKSKIVSAENSPQDTIEMIEESPIESALDKAIKLASMCGILVISTSIFYYYMIFMPKLENEKINQKNQVEIAKLQKDKEIEIARLNQQGQVHLNRTQNLKTCIHDVEQNYELGLVNSCKKFGLDTREENCVLPPYYLSHAEMIRTENREVCLKLYGEKTF